MQQNRPFSKKVPPDLPSAKSRTKKSPPARHLFRRRTESPGAGTTARAEQETKPRQNPRLRRTRAGDTVTFFGKPFFRSDSFSGAERRALPAGPGRDLEQGHPHEQSRKRNRGRAPRLCRTRARDAVTFFGKPFFESGSYVGIKKGALHEQSRKRNRGRAPRLRRIRARDAIKFFGKPFFQKRFVVQ